jgi:hypothetical protein
MSSAGELSSQVLQWSKKQPIGAIPLSMERKSLIDYFKPWKKFENAEQWLKNEVSPIWWPKTWAAKPAAGIGLVRVTVHSLYGRGNAYNVYILYCEGRVLDLSCESQASTKLCHYQYV